MVAAAKRRVLGQQRAAGDAPLPIPGRGRGGASPRAEANPPAPSTRQADHESRDHHPEPPTSPSPPDPARLPFDRDARGAPGRTSLRSRTRIIESKELAALAARIADDKKGVDIRVLAVAPHTSIADYFVLATGLSRPQVRAIQQEIHVRLKALGHYPMRVEGADMGWWVLLDYADVVVHVMQPEAREYYDLDGLYNEATELDWAAVELPAPKLPAPESA